jgi:hypothetical protein
MANKKNSLEAFKNLPKHSVLESEAKTPKKEPEKVQNKAAGRPVKAKKDKEDYRINFCLTKAEGVILESKAGIASVNTFVKHFLRNETDITKK